MRHPPLPGIVRAAPTSLKIATSLPSKTAGSTPGLVSSAALPSGNFFTLTAYADEASQPAAAGTTIELDASGIRSVGGFGKPWVDLETGETASRAEWFMAKSGINAAIVGNNVESISYSVEGGSGDAYLEALFADDPTNMPTHSTSFVFPCEDVAIRDDASSSLSEANVILSICAKMSYPAESLSLVDAMTAGNLTFDEEFSLGHQCNTYMDMAAAQAIADCTLTLTATFTDGSTQTKTYDIGLVADYEQRIADYWNAVEESGHDYELALHNDEEPSDEAIAKAENHPEEPALYALTEIA